MAGETSTTLTAAGGAVLVAAMATEAWQTTRCRMAQLLAQGCPARQTIIEAQLDANAALVAQAEDPERVRQSLAPMWRLQLEALLLQYPQAEDELRALIKVS